MTTPPAWTQAIHHDGSADYVSNPLPALNETVEITLRTPTEAPLRAVYLRTEPDGEQHFTRMEPTHQNALRTDYRAALTVRNRRMVYRFKLLTDTGAFFYTAQGISRADSPDHTDFKLLAAFEFPNWLRTTVFYQIFPDRFYNGDPSLNPAEGELFEHPPFEPFTTQMRPWDAEPLPFKDGGTVDFYGGDLPGIAHKLPYLQRLGVNALYLNPIFASTTNHKYNIRSFTQVDPDFGGNAALAALREALDEADMRYVLDLTPNHIGNDHEWFAAAQADPAAPTADYFTFYNHPDDYECWLGVKTLPKLNYDSSALRDHMYRAADSVMRRWLHPPYRADGWRLDVWNMTARQGSSDHHHQVGREMRAAIKEAQPAAYLFGEHFFDSTPSLQGDEMDGTMNYQGFSFPVWRWLVGHDLGAWQEEPQPYTDNIPMPAEAAAEQMTAFMAAVPWAVTCAQFNQLGSHDTPRILTVCRGDRALAALGAALLLTFPGVPCIYYGDEIGMEGGRDPENRRAMIWDQDRQDADLLAHYQTLIKLRRTHPALTDGGFQFLYAQGDTLAYLRTRDNQRVIVVGYRGDGPSQPITVPVWHAAIPDGTAFTDALNGASVTATVTDGGLTLGVLQHGTALVLISG